MSFSDKQNINILTSLLPRHGIGTAVLCPGSRNAPICHNLLEAGMECHSVTDERSAGFYALGLALATRRPVAVCVTSGSALLNLAPAVAEAAYRHIPLVIISADRPADRIGQLAGQTIPQPGALGAFAGYCCSLPEPHDAVSERYCVRLVNEALIRTEDFIPVHINVPVSEPLFNFTVDNLPKAPLIVRYPVQRIHGSAGRNAWGFLNEEMRPLVIIGQIRYNNNTSRYIREIGREFPVLFESLSSVTGGLNIDMICDFMAADRDLWPDRVLYVGDTLISNKIKGLIASIPDVYTLGVDIDGEVHDTFLDQVAVIKAEPVQFLREFASECTHTGYHEEYKARWESLITYLQKTTREMTPRSPEARAVKMLEEELKESDVNMHYANSTAARLGNLYSHHYTYVNRGVNGIEGSLSTAAGFSLASPDKTFCVIGDLSFLYDSNALWNTEIDGRLRILLLNNGGGKIFDTLPGANGSPAFATFVKGSHTASARGLCESYNIRYIGCDNGDQLPESIRRLIHDESDRPVLLECLIQV